MSSRATEKDGQGLDVAEFDRFGKPKLGVAGGDEFLAHESLVLDLKEGFHDGRIVDFLLIIEFSTARVACGVDVPDHVPAFADATDNVPVHDLDVINVEEQFDPGRADGIEDFHAVVDMIALISGMSFVGVAIVPTVEHFQADGNAFFLGVPSHLLEALDTVLGPFLEGEFFRVTGKGDDVRASEVGRVVDGLLGHLEKHVVVLGIIESLDERGTLKGKGGNGAVEIMLFQFGPMLGRDQLDALAA